MGEKTYEAIYKVAKTTESDIIILWVDHFEIRGILLDCDDNKCISGVVTLQDVTVKCSKHHHDMEAEDFDSEKHFRWLNIPACHIKAFTFKCCMIDD